MAITGTVNNVGNDSSDTPTEPIPGAILYTPQYLTETQQEQALANIGAVSVEANSQNISDVEYDEESGEFRFVSVIGVKKIKIPLHISVVDIEIDVNDLVVKFSDSKFNKILKLPVGNKNITVNDVEPDEFGRIRIDIANIRGLGEELTSRATNTDITNLRGLKVEADELNQELVILDAADVVLNRFNVGWLANANVNKTPKSEYFKLSDDDLSRGDNLLLKLQETPSKHEHVMVFCNGVLLNSSAILVNENILEINKRTVEYEFKSGMKITVNYKY